MEPKLTQVAPSLPRYASVPRNLPHSAAGRPNAGRKAFSVLVAFAAVVALTTGCETTSQERALVISLVNDSRIANGLRPVRMNNALNAKADAWASHLRDVCSLSHSHLSDGAPNEWQKLGENVGYGGAITQVHTAYLNSPGHRANILDPTFTSMGAAAVWGDCDGEHRVFTVQEFMKS